MVKAQQEADANYNAAMEEYNAQVAEAEETLNAWTGIYALMNGRKRAARERQEAEQRERDKQLHDEAVAQVEEQKRIAAEKAAEQAEVGTHVVNPKLKEKWDKSAKVEGNPNALTLADGSTLRGHYVLTEAGAASASHDINNAFEPTEGFPIDENGESVNDRDYKRDTDAQQIVRDIARNYDSRALQPPVIVSKDGIVLSGNNRTMSGDMAAQQGTDKAYIDHLREFGQMYGFTPEQIGAMKHPRVVFVPDEELPYDAATFARFNAEQQKKQSKPEQAVKLGKVVPDNVFNSIVGDISRYDRLSDYYADDKAVASAISQLLGAGVINEMQLPEMRTGNALSAAGRELIENTLIGKVFQTSPDAVRHIIGTSTLRQSVVMGLNEIAHNRTLAKSGYDLSQELGAAVDLVARARSVHLDVFKDGMPVSPFGWEQGLFDDEYGDSRVTDGLTLMLADILNSGKPSELRKFLSVYNNEAASPAGGQLDMFSGKVTSKEELLNRVTEYFRNATPREQQAIVDAAVAERKQRAEAAAQVADGTKRDGGSTNQQGVGGVQEETRNDVANEPMSHDEAIAFIAAMENRAEVAPSVDLSIENWDALFGKDGIVNTPIGEVKMGDNQFTKMMREDRHGKLGMVKPTLENPDVILEDASKAKEGDTEERPSSYIFVKAFKKADGSRYYYFTSITVSKDGREVVVSNQEKRKNAIANLLSKDRLVWKHADDVSDASDVAQGLYSSQGNVSDLATEGTDAPQTGMSNSIWSASDGKDINKQTTLQENGGKSSENKVETPLSEQIATASAEVDTEPTEAQKEAGNYKKGHVQVGTFDITIEQPQGSVRKGTDADGKQWESKMHNTYGYFRGTEGVDGDHIDVFLSNDIDGWNGRKVYVVDQYNPDGTFDEHKVMLGFNDADEAKSDYLANYEKGWEDGRRIVVSATNLEDFEKWICSSHRKTKPFAEYAGVKKETVANAPAKGEATEHEGIFKMAERIAKEGKAERGKKNKASADVKTNSTEARQKAKDGKPRLQKMDDSSVMDAEYFAAIERGDMEEAQRIVNEAAKRAGYSVSSDYQGTSAYNGAAPYGNGYFLTKEERKEAWDNGDFEGESTLGDYIGNGVDGGNLEELTNNSSYRHADDMRKEAIENVRDAIENGRNTITMYRSVPSSVQEGKFRNGDWITPSRKYAEDNAEIHGWGKGYRIIEQEVPVDEVWFDGNDIAEWGYGREEDYVNDTDFAYKNTENNRKLLDVITRDDDGNIIPPSERFNRRKADERYQKGGTASRPTQAETALRDAVIDHLRENGIEVIDNDTEGQRVLDEANGGDAQVRLQAKLSALSNAANIIRGWLTDNKRGKSFTIELPETTRRMVFRAMGRDFDSHNITANGVAHAQKNHGINGQKLNGKSMPLTKADMELIPYIMTAPDYVRRGSSDVSGRVSVRFYKELSNGYVVVAEKEYKNSPNDMETITMWAELSDKATNAQQGAAPDTHVQNAILDIDVAKIRKDAEDTIAKDQNLREHRVYHGSGADFDHFDHSHMGEGEGSQAYGWGTYVTEVEGIGRTYAERAVNVVANVPKKMAYSIAQNDYDNASNLLNLEQTGLDLYVNQVKLLEKEKKRYEDRLNDPQNKDFAEDIKKSIAELDKSIQNDKVEIEKSERNIEEYQKKVNVAKEELDKAWTEYEKAKKPHNLYTVEIPEDNGENYLDWDKPLPDGFDNEAVKERVMDDKRTEDELENGMMERDLSDSMDYAATGKDLYKAISLYVGDKAASEMLHDIGYVGIKYPADNMRGGRDDGTKNYVIFNEKDAKITDHVRFFRTADGEAYGFTVGGRIYIDPRIATSETPIHEYAHLWATALRNGNPKEWRNVVGLMKGTPVWDEVKKRYPELETDDEIADEVIAAYSGRRGAERLREEAKETADGDGGVFEKAKAVGALQRVRAALGKFWRAVADFLHIHYTSAEEVADRVMKDLLDGIDPRSMMDGGKSLRPDTEINVVEGAEEHGFKNYAEAKEWAKDHIVRTYNSEETSGKGDIRISGTAVDKYLSQSAVDKSESKDVHLSVLRVLPDVIRESVDAEQHADFKKGEDGVRSGENGINPNVTIHRLYGAVGMDGRLYRVKVTLKEDTKSERSAKKAYSYEATKIELLAGTLGKPEGDAPNTNNSITAANLLKGVEKSYGGGRFFEDYNKIREQFIGEKGAERADHAEEVTTRLDNLSVAREMEAAKKDAKAIKMATGWERGADGKWRYEIPDCKVSSTMDIGGKVVKRNEEDMLWTSGKLGDVVDAPELLAAYPELEQVRLETDEIMDDMPSNGEYNPRTNTITIHADELKYLNSILNHEIQHAIQHLEGFARGGNPADIDRGKANIREVFDKISNGLDDAAKLRGIPTENEWLQSLDGDAVKVMEKQLKAYQGKNFALTRVYVDNVGFDNHDKELLHAKLDQANDIIEKQRKELGGTEYIGNSFEAYRRLGGEVESRNVEKRMGMAAEERRASLAAETEDVSREDQIFLMDGGEGDSYSLREADGEEDAEVKYREDDGVVLSASEYAKLSHAIHTHNNFKIGEYNGEFTDNYYYIYTHHGDGDFTVECQIPIEGNEELIKRIQNGIGKRTDGGTGRVASAVDGYWLGRNADNSNYASVEGRHWSDEGLEPVHIRQSSDNWRNNEKLGDGLSQGPSAEKERIKGDTREAMAARAEELAGRLNTAVRIVRTDEEVAALPSARQRRMKGSFNPMTGDAAASGHYYADMAEAHAEAGRKRGQFRREATEEYGAELAGRIGESGFEKMSAEELTFWGKLKAMLQKALQKLLDGLKIPGKKKWGDKEWAFVLHEAYKRKKNGGRPTVFDAADTEVMRRKTGFGNEMLGDGDGATSPDGSVDEINRTFNDELQQQIDGKLPEGHIYKMGKSGKVLLSTGVPNLPIQMNASRLQAKATSFGHNFDISEVRDLVKALQHPLAVFAYGDMTKAQNIIVPLQKDGKNFIVGLSLNPVVNGRKLEINSIRNVFPKKNSEWINWISQGKALYMDKEKIQTFIDQQRTNLADVDYLDLDSVAKVVENFENPNVPGGKVSEDGLLYRKPYGGNSGYVGYSISRRGAEAKAEGRYPKTEFRKEYGITEPSLKALVEAGVIDGGEWHHTSSYGNRTAFYGWSDGNGAEAYIRNKGEIDRLSRVIDKSSKLEAEGQGYGYGDQLDNYVQKLQLEGRYRQMMTPEERSEYRRRQDGVSDSGKPAAERIRLHKELENEYFTEQAKRERAYRDELRESDGFKAFAAEAAERKRQLDEAKRAAGEAKRRICEIFEKAADEGMKFRDGGMGLDETITRMKAAASQANADNWQSKQEAMKAIGGNLNKLRIVGMQEYFCGSSL